MSIFLRPSMRLRIVRRSDTRWGGIRGEDCGCGGGGRGSQRPPHAVAGLVSEGPQDLRAEPLQASG